MEILTSGPWTVQGSILSLMPWKANFQPLQQTIKSAPVWICLPGLPLEYWSPESVANIASMVGKPLRMDERSFSLARVCVELDLEQPLTEGVWVGEEEDETFFQIVSYENIPTLCKACGCLGHSTHNYMNPATKSDRHLGGAQENASSDVAVGSTSAKENSPLPQVELPEVGPWIRVQQRKGRRMPARQPAEVSQKTNTMEYEAPMGCTSNPRPRPNHHSKEKTPIACHTPQQEAQTDPLQTPTTLEPNPSSDPTNPPDSSKARWNTQKFHDLTPFTPNPQCSSFTPESILAASVLQNHLSPIFKDMEAKLTALTDQEVVIPDPSSAMVIYEFEKV